MRTIRQAGSHEFEERRSRFLCALERVETEQQAREFIRTRRREHHEARHHCTAYVLGDRAETQKSNDDGEPSGTAGAPMLEVLRRNEVTNTVAVVSRYFGGVLLGAGGLVRAYGTSVSLALGEVGLVERRPARLVSISVAHALAGRLDNDLRVAHYRPIDVRYGQLAEFDVAVPEGQVDDFRQWVADATGGGAEVSLGDSVHTEEDLRSPDE